MARHVLLNNVQHQNLRVITRHSAQFGDEVGGVVVFPTEFREIQREYPIFFRKEPGSEDFLAVAMLGFAKDENLFLGAGGWAAHYIPAVVTRGPFLIGFQEDHPVIHIDLDHPRVSETEGEPLFLPMGGTTPYLHRMATVLDALHRGLKISKEMFAAFAALDLVEALKLEIKLTGDEQHNLLGYYTINAEKLRGLDREPLAQLHRAGFLEAAYLALTSLNNMQKLVDKKLRRHRESVQVSGAEGQ